ncbi:MAG TPA: purine-nucleoside phosphorylase, partial [Acidimicrobiales bacterium]|nr:purine-nucleoside phosphorylase [Acidimicrobiales bacterium]
MGDGPWSLVEAAATAVGERTGVAAHEVAVVLGSGWVPAADRIGETVAEVRAVDLPGFATPVVAGHADVVRSVRTEGGRAVLVMGRVHAYEGHDPATVVHGVRVAARTGCRALVVTNAAGAVRHGLPVGRPVLVADHLNLTGRSPLEGDGATGSERFVDLTDAYSARLRAVAREVDPSLVDGVYAGVGGPQYETPAEIRMLQQLGADLVGMSTVHEVIAARHAGLEVLAISLVTNLAAGLGDAGLDHAAVVDA